MPKVKKFRWEIDEDDATQGVKVISLVDEPAMESEFIAFSKQKIKPKYVAFAADKEYKQIVAGLALIPEKEIPRLDDNGDEYVGYFTAETIEQIRNKFHKEQNDQEVNTDHDEKEDVDAYMISDYIVDSDLQVEDLVKKGIEEATIGSWFVAYKIEDKEVFDKVLEGEYTGFSVELFADRILESFKYNYINKNKFSMKDLIEKFKAIINEFDATETEEVQEEVKLEDEVSLERAAVPSLEIIIEWGEIGEAVNSVITDEEGEETLEPLEDGTYELEDGRKLVIVDGVLSEIIEAEAPAEEEEAKKDDEALEEEEVKAEDEIEVTVSAKQALQDLGIDFSQDGYYTVEVGVEGGEPVWGSIYASTYKDLKFKAENFEARETEIVDLKKQIDDLKLKIKEPIAEPNLGIEQKVEVDVDLSKLSNYERIALKNGLAIV